MSGGVGGIGGNAWVSGQKPSTEVRGEGLVGNRSVSNETSGPSRSEGGVKIGGNRTLQQRSVGVVGQSGVNPPSLRPAGPLNARIGERLATFDGLVEKMGGRPPHKDVRIGPLVIWRHSIAYKEVKVALQNYQQQLARPLPEAGPERDSAVASLREAMTAVEKGAQHYVDYHAGNKAKASEVGVMKEILTQIGVERGLLDEAEGDPALSTVAGDVSLGVAMQAKRAGIAYADCSFSSFRDSDLKRDLCNETFGSGMANSVAKLVYSDGKEYVFKPESFTDQGTDMALPKPLGIDLDHPHYANRNIAALSLDKVLGANALCNARVIEHDGRIGLLMDLAEGKSPVGESKRPANEQELAKLERFREIIEPEDLEAYLNADGLSFDTSGKLIKTESFAQDVLVMAGDRVTDETRPQLVQQLTGLEWSDCLSGQADRHGKNYFVDIDGNGRPSLSGIDNDMCFGHKTTAVLPFGRWGSVQSPGLPQVIDRAMFDKISGLDFDRDVLPGLQGLLSGPEIDATRSRITEIKTHAQSLNPDFVVDDWQAWRDPDGDRDVMTFLAESDKVSLWQRDFISLEV